MRRQTLVLAGLALALGFVIYEFYKRLGLTALATPLNAASGSSPVSDVGNAINALHAGTSTGGSASDFPSTSAGDDSFAVGLAPYNPAPFGFQLGETAFSQGYGGSEYGGVQPSAPVSSPVSFSDAVGF